MFGHVSDPTLGNLQFVNLDDVVVWLEAIVKIILAAMVWCWYTILNGLILLISDRICGVLLDNDIALFRFLGSFKQLLLSVAWYAVRAALLHLRSVVKFLL